MLDLTNPRTDLIRRLFPMAISVGFAGPLVQMSWLTNGPIPTMPEFEQLARLFVSMLFVLISWDWFHKDMISSPPRTMVRFLTDVAIVLAYMLFLIFSRSQAAWLVSIVMVFFLYVIWDILSLSGCAERPENGSPNVIVRYRQAFSRKSLTADAVPAINLCWFLYFLMVLLLQHRRGYDHPWAAFLLLLASVIVIRMESDRLAEINEGGNCTRIVTRGFSMIWRLVAMCALLVPYTTWVYLRPLL